MGKQNPFNRNLVNNQIEVALSLLDKSKKDRELSQEYLTKYSLSVYDSDFQEITEDTIMEDITSETPYLRCLLVKVLVGKKKLKLPTTLTEECVSLVRQQHRLAVKMKEWPLKDFSIESYIPTDFDMETVTTLVEDVRTLYYREEQRIADSIEKFSNTDSQKEKEQIVEELALWYEQLKREAFSIKEVIPLLVNNLQLLYKETSLIASFIGIVLLFFLGARFF